MFVFASLITSVRVLALNFQPLGLLQSSTFPTELPASVTGERLPRHRNCLATVSDRAAMLTKHSNVICVVISVAQDAGRTAAHALLRLLLWRMTKSVMLLNHGKNYVLQKTV